MFTNQHQLISTLNNSLRIGRTHNYRVLLVLAGDANEYLKPISDTFIKSVKDHTAKSQMSRSVSSASVDIMHVPDLHSNSDVSDKINSLLGGEHSFVIFDARSNFEERLFAAAAGSVTAGGLLVLQTPPLHEWATQQYSSTVVDQQSLFISRLCQKLTFHLSIAVNAKSSIEGQSETLHNIPSDTALFIAATTQETDTAHLYSNAPNKRQEWRIEQDSMLKALVNNLQCEPESVSVVQGDRGRGKSTLIGRAMKHLMASESSQHRSISITANRRGACNILLKNAQQPIRFVAIDKALSTTHDVLIVEEAGSIPIPVLEQLLHKSQSIIFATTVQGYEGAGRGFAIRFAKKLNQLKPGWLSLNPILPIRWSTGDPLEAFVNDTLLLKTELPTIKNSSTLIPDNSHVSLIEKHTLANDELILAQVYGLLVQAHYQTTPADLRNLLDKSHLLLFVQKTGQVLTGVALVALEGEISDDLHKMILHKQRRLADQILPQLLAQSSGETDVLKERFARIVRIAIHPAIHQQGFGTHLFKQLHKQLTTDATRHGRVNSIGTSFGADEQTLSFWLKQGLTPIHYGYKTNPRSALRAACLISSKQLTVRESIDKACRILRVNTQAQLTQDAGIDSVQKKLLAATKSTDNIGLSSQNAKRLIHDFYQARRSFIDTVGLLLSYEFNNDTDAVHQVVRDTLNEYRQMSPNTRRSAEEHLRAILRKTDAIIEFD